MSNKIDHQSHIDVDKLSETFRYDYVRFALNTNFSFSHYHIIKNLLDREMNSIIKSVAMENPIEFMRYKQCVSDQNFAILFNNKDRNTSKIIDLCEELLLYKHHDRDSVTRDDVMNSVTFKELENKGDIK
jgi:hypothetical protein